MMHGRRPWLSWASSAKIQKTKNHHERGAVLATPQVSIQVPNSHGNTDKMSSINGLLDPFAVHQGVWRIVITVATHVSHSNKCLSKSHENHCETTQPNTVAAAFVCASCQSSSRTKDKPVTTRVCHPSTTTKSKNATTPCLHHDGTQREPTY